MRAVRWRYLGFVKQRLILRKLPRPFYRKNLVFKLYMVFLVFISLEYFKKIFIKITFCSATSRCILVPFERYECPKNAAKKVLTLFLLYVSRKN